MILAGLGNPGEKFKDTRHNIGFEIIDEFKEKNNFPDFKLKKSFEALISEGEFNGKKIVLAKPQTFMNLSGKAIKKILKNLPAKEKENLVVLHDDVDLALGEIKIAKNRGSGGHKGVESVIKEIGTEDFTRIRFGIIPNAKKPKNVEKFVLQKFSKEEEKILKEITEKAVEALEIILKEGPEKAMNKFN